MQDMQINCAGCGGVFLFTAAEQAFYAERGFQVPKRCRRCRQARKTGGRSGRAPRPGGSARLAAASGRRAVAEAAARSTYSAHCAGCGSQTEVPFAPRDRQAFCAVCFTARCEALVGAGDDDDES